MPAKWVRTNRGEGVLEEGFGAKSRMVVQDFRGKSLGDCRRGALAASKLAEAMALLAIASKGM
eukprot:9472394-Pyramimonas_sp.AAC.1